MKNQNLNKLTIIVLFLLVIFSSHTLKAQSEFGVVGGTNISKFNVSNDELLAGYDQKFKSGLTLGVFYKKRNLLGPVGFQAELLYQSKGTNMFTKNYNSQEYGYSQTSWYRNHEKLHYLTVPILFSISPVKNIELYIGNHVGFLVNYEDQRQTDGSNKKRFAYGLDSGIAYKLNKSSIIDFRYSADLTKFDYMNDFSKSKLKNYNFEVTFKKTLLWKE